MPLKLAAVLRESTNPMVNAMRNVRMQVGATHWRDVDGPWVGEPDECFWLDEETEYPCACLRDPSGALVSFVAGGKKWPSRGEGCIALRLDARAGYRGRLAQSDIWSLSIIGGDKIVYWHGTRPSIFATHLYHTLDFCKAECRQVARSWKASEAQKKRGGKRPVRALRQAAH